MEGKEIEYGDGPAPTYEFQGPGYGFSFGDPDLAVKQLMPNAPQWAKSQVRHALEDEQNIRHSKDLFGLA